MDKLVEDAELERILAQTDDEVNFAELHRLYNYADDDSRQFTRHQMVVAMTHGFNQAREHMNMLRKAEAAIAQKRVNELEAALREAADAMTCRRDDDAHYCPNCDNSLYDARAKARAALPTTEVPGESEEEMK